ncbi:MAG TPA: hypothetical protein VER11_34475 [Polyangiaceae bacterium]|nr:hypothetical protein [Polyangiaceae bacterium]
MPGLSGLALTKEETIEILSVYATAEERIDAVTSAPGWEAIGAFPIPATADIRLDVLGSVSDAALTLTVRLYDITSGHEGPVAGSEVNITSLLDAQAFSATFTVIGNHRYQVHAQVVGASGASYFGHILRAAPAGV